MHHIILERTNILRTIKLNLSLNEEEYEVLVENFNKYKEYNDNIIIAYWMKSGSCSKYHYNKIWRTFNNRLPGIKLIILD